MATLLPANPDECASMLHNCAQRKQLLQIAGNGSKRLMGGPIHKASETLSTCRMNRLLQYEPADLTVSVEAGMRWCELQKTLGDHRQRIALDPPFRNESTVGGIIATNLNGPIRRAHGTARDLVIGMRFAMTDGRLIESGGMVVKNVAGLDLAKIMIGSFGTLGVITSVNFRVHSALEQTRTFLFQIPALDDCIAKRDEILKGVLQPEALDVFSPVTSARLGLRGYVLAIRAGGSCSVLERYSRELPEAMKLKGADEETLWQRVREFTPDFLKRQPSGVIVRVSTTLSGVRGLLKASSDAVMSRAASGVNYVYLNSANSLAGLFKAVRENQWRALVEFAPDDFRENNELWPDAGGNAFELMQNLKAMFDPENILNPRRLYGRI